jgi:chaperonin GroEL
MKGISNMEFLKYSNDTQSNIIPQSEFEGLVQEVFNVIATNLSKSLGPLGSSATILDGSLTEATKDGYSILKKYRFHNKYKRMVLNLILAPCTKMNNTVGDGTTTAIALTNEMFNAYKNNEGKLKTLYRLPRQFTSAWDEVINELCNRVINDATPIDLDSDTIYNLAYVSSNGNSEISKYISDIYKETATPSIKQKDSPTNKSYVEKIDGFDFAANLISDAYVKNEDLSISLDNVYLMIFDHKMETDFMQNIIFKINEVLKAKGSKLLIIAPQYDVLMCETILQQYTTYEFRNGGINLLPIQYLSAKIADDELGDLAVILKGKVITQSLAGEIAKYVSEYGPDMVVDEILNNPEYAIYQTICQAKSVLLSCNNGSIFRPYDDIVDDQRYKDLLIRVGKDLDDIKSQTDYERQSFGEKIYKTNARLTKLHLNSYIYYVGADSALQKNILWDSIEDVIKCIKSATQYGIVPGCQITIIKECLAYAEDILAKSKENKDIDPEYEQLKIEIINMIATACLNVYGKILTGPDNLGIVKTLPRWQYTNEDGLKDLMKEAAKKRNDIIQESLSQNKVYDIGTLEYNENIVTSAETDKMVLMVASELVKILISGNQCIVMDPDVDNSHQETVQAYV